MGLFYRQNSYFVYFVDRFIPDRELELENNRLVYLLSRVWVDRCLHVSKSLEVRESRPFGRLSPFWPGSYRRANGSALVWLGHLFPSSAGPREAIMLIVRENVLWRGQAVR